MGHLLNYVGPLLNYVGPLLNYVGYRLNYSGPPLNNYLELRSTSLELLLQSLCRYLGLEVLELTDSVARPGIAARVRALARPSKTTPRPWVNEAGAREGLEI